MKYMSNKRFRLIYIPKNSLFVRSILAFTIPPTQKKTDDLKTLFGGIYNLIKKGDR